MNPLESQDIDILLEALQAWENKDDFSAAMGSILSSFFVNKDDPEAKAKLAEKEQAEKVRLGQLKAQRKERSVLLQAKLIQMRPSVIAEDVSRMLSK